MNFDAQMRPLPRILVVVVFLYAASFIKFFDRDPLSAQVGPQGPIELAILVGIVVTLFMAFHRYGWKLVLPPSAKAFVAFGAVALLSSVFSFYPMLSFAKGLSFILVCGIAVALSSVLGPVRVVKYLYYSIVIILAIDLFVKLASGGPLFEIDDYTGRTRLFLFGFYPTLLGELTAVTSLSGFLLSKRPPLYCQVFLFGLNIAADSRTSSTLLVILLLAIWLATVRPNPRLIFFLCCCLGCGLALVIWVSIYMKDRPTDDVASISRPFYGDTVDDDLTSLNGRTDVWNAAAPVIGHSLFLGYGLGGARDVLVHNTSQNWVAGDAHNAGIELVLAAGFPAVVVFFFGWAGAVRRAWRSLGSKRVAALALYAFIAGFGLVAPNLTNLQALCTFLIITTDATVCMELYPSRYRKPLATVAPLGKEPLANPVSS